MVTGQYNFKSPDSLTVTIIAITTFTSKYLLPKPSKEGGHVETQVILKHDAEPVPSLVWNRSIWQLPLHSRRSVSVRSSPSKPSNQSTTKETSASLKELSVTIRVMLKGGGEQRTIIDPHYNLTNKTFSLCKANCFSHNTLSSGPLAPRGGSDKQIKCYHCVLVPSPAGSRHGWISLEIEVLSRCDVSFCKLWVWFYIFDWQENTWALIQNFEPTSCTRTVFRLWILQNR